MTTTSTIDQLESMIKLIDGGGLQSIAEHRDDYALQLSELYVKRKGELQKLMATDLKHDVHYTKDLQAEMDTIQSNLSTSL